MKPQMRIRILAAISIPIALGVFALKYWAYYLTGSIALYSDALESVVNVIAAVAAWWAIHIGLKPADDDHPFGHHKAEYFSAVLEGVLIIVAALIIIHEAWGAFVVPRNFEQAGLGLGINLGAGILNAIWAVVLLRQGQRSRSPALKADGLHLLTDVFTSLGVLLGLIAAVLTGWTILDPVLAMVVAVNILWQGWKVINASVQGLMDGSVEQEETQRIRAIITAHANGSIEVHDLKTRLAGQVIFIEFHLVVASDMRVGQAHDICDNIENALQDAFEDAKVVIHVEPEGEAKLPASAEISDGKVPFA